MSLFSDQISERRINDQDLMDEICIKMAESALGKRFLRRIGSDPGKNDNDAIALILNYYNIKECEIPEKIESLDEKLEYVLQPHGIMRRRVHLDKNWYKNACGPFLGMETVENTTVALLPKKNGMGYRYFDSNTGKYVNVCAENADRIDSEVYCFYRPFPLKKLRVKDLLIYMKDLVSLKEVSLLFLLYLVSTLLGLLSPKFTQFLYGEIPEFNNYYLLLSLGFFMIMVGISNLLVGTVSNIVTTGMNTKISIYVEAAAMMRILSLPTSFFREFSAGQLSGITGYVNSLCSMLVGTIMSTSVTSLFSLIYITQIFNYAPSLVLPSVIIVLITCLFSVASTLIGMKVSRQRMDISTREQGVAYSMISGIEKIKLSGAEVRAFSKWGEVFSKRAALEYNPPLFIKINPVLNTAIGTFSTIVMYALTARSGLSISEYSAFNIAFGMLSGAFSAVLGIVLEITNIFPILDICKPILDAEPENAENKEVLSEVRGNIRIDNLCFRYNESMPYIFENFSLEIKKGQYVAIVGKTGCGKSTLIRLLLGFEKPEKGVIYFDNKDISKLDIKSLRRNIGTVLQDGKVFQGDIFSNIVISAPKANLDDAWEAAAMAGLDEDIRNMPMGMNTMISEGQGGISGGQKQRLMIARAVASRPNVLIFDEATSALDNVTQKKVSDSLDTLKCTRICIAHRLSTIKNCDRIIVIDGGRIVEDGNYEELIKKDGFFKELVARQMVGEDI